MKLISSSAGLFGRERRRAGPLSYVATAMLVAPAGAFAQDIVFDMPESAAVNVLDAGIVSGPEPLVVLSARIVSGGGDGAGIDPSGELCLSVFYGEFGSDVVTIEMTVRGVDSEETVTFMAQDAGLDPGSDCDSAGQPPTANAGGPYSAEIPPGAAEASIQLDGSASTDDNAPLASWEWQIESGGTVVTTTTGEMPSPIMLPEGTYLATLTVADRDELFGPNQQPVDVQKTDMATANITVTAASGDEPPVANAGADQTVADTDGDGVEPVQLDGSASTDDSGIVAYSWSEDGTEIATGVQPEVSLPVGTHTIVLTVFDGAEQSDDATVVVTVEPAPGAPVANAGPDQTVADDDGDGVELAQLDGSQSGSELGIVGYSWSEDGTEIATGVQPEVSLSVGTHTIVLTVFDEAEQSDADTVVITVGAQAERELSDLPGLSQNEQSVATVIDGLCAQLAEQSTGEDFTPEQQEMLTRCMSLMSTEVSDADAAAALDALNGEEMISQQTSALDYSNEQLGNLGNRITALRGGSGGGVSVAGLNLSHDGRRIPLQELAAFTDYLLTGGGASGDETEESGGLLGDRFGIFVNGSLRTGDQDQTANEAGFDFDGWGITAGVDYRFTSSLVLGVGLGYNESKTKFDDAGGRIDGDSLSASLYGTYFNDDLYFDFIGSFGSIDYDSVRNITYTDAGGVQNFTAVGQTDGDLRTLGLSFGYDFHIGGATLGPTLALNRVEVDVDAFAESGAGGLGLAFGGQEAVSQTAQGGFRFSYAISRPWGILSPHARFSFVKEMKDEAQVLVAHFVNDPFINDPGQPSSAITIVGDNPDENYRRWGIGVSAVFLYGMSAFIDYESYAGFRGLDSHELSFGFRIQRSFR